MKPTREDILQEQVAAALKGIPHVIAQQCMYLSLAGSMSPVRVYVETDFCKRAPSRLPNQSVADWKQARKEWKAQAQADARHAIVVASIALSRAGFQFKSVEDYGWAQLTILGGAK